MNIRRYAHDNSTEWMPPWLFEMLMITGTEWIEIVLLLNFTGLSNHISCFRRLVYVFKSLFRRIVTDTIKIIIQTFKSYLCSVVVINQVFYVIKDAQDANRFKLLYTEIVLQPEASLKHQKMTEVWGVSFWNLYFFEIVMHSKKIIIQAWGLPLQYRCDKLVFL